MNEKCLQSILLEVEPTKNLKGISQSFFFIEKNVHQIR
jgi:hypothetical protein